MVGYNEHYLLWYNIMNPILVAGTWAWQDDGKTNWFCPGHPFGQFLTEQGFPPTYDGDKPFIWSTDLAGVPFFTSKKDWAAGGAALAYFVKEKLQCPGEQTAIIEHSHGLQVVAYAAAEHDLKINTLISVGSPIRKDMQKQYEALRSNTKYWLHIHSDKSDHMQWFGELFDGHFGIVRETPLADRNDFVPKVGHSDLLYYPNLYHFWKDKGWLLHLKG